ncbi:hypothetical protein ACFZAI_25495 [Achromobacter sp. NPDC008082]|uniref:hypothetical protein n=1 Tax=Achromobacter sp. NPDC008082 TaxID=3363888 RepID=UPI0036E0B022
MMTNRFTTWAELVSRRQVLRFYPWSVKQRQNCRVMGCAAMFTYLTEFCPSENRPFLKTGLTSYGDIIFSTKRKKGLFEVLKIGEWSTRLRDRAKTGSKYLFAPKKALRGTRSDGSESSWKGAQLAWILTFDQVKEKIIAAHPLYFTPPGYSSSSYYQEDRES